MKFVDDDDDDELLQTDKEQSCRQQSGVVTHANLDNEVAQMFLKLWDVLVEADEAFNEHFDLSAATFNTSGT